MIRKTLQHILPFACSLLVFTACSDEVKQSDTWVMLDLLPHGIPIEIMAPDSAQVNVVRVGSVEDVSIRNEGQAPYSVQIFVQPALSSDIAVLKSNQLDEVRSNPMFGRIIEEDEQSFIFSLNDAQGETFSFRYTHLQADKEYIFTTGFNERFSLEEVKRLLEAVRQ